VTGAGWLVSPARGHFAYDGTTNRVTRRWQPEADAICADGEPAQRPLSAGT
jgi:hypothetical protein